MKRTFTFLMTALFLCVGMTVKAQHWLQPTVSTDKETYEYYIANYRNGEYFVTSTKGLSGGAQQLGSAKAFDDTKAKVTFKLVEGGKLWSTNTTTPLIVGYTTTEGAANSVQLFAEDSQEGYTWKIEYANGGNTLSAGSSGNSWNMHGGAGANIGLYGKTDGGSNWVFIPANDAAVAKAAEVKAMYAPSTEYYYQIKNVKYSRMLAANATNATSISTNSTADLNQLWAFEEGEDGAFYLRNAGQEKYLVAASSDNTAWTVGAEGSAFELEMLNFSIKNWTIHAVGQDGYGFAHDANWGTDARIVRWEASAEASQWYLEKTEISTKAVGISLVYSLTYNGEEKFTHTCTGFVGEAYPEVNVALPFGIVATKPAGELTADVAGKVVEVKLSDNLPFAYAADVKSVESWYYLLFHATGKNYLYYAADDAVLEANKTAVDTNDKDAYAWAFVGNPFDGFKVYNKKAGKFLDAAKDGAVVAAADEQVFTLTASSYASNGFFMQAKDGEYKERFNKQSGKVVYWGGADAGSTFMVSSELTYTLTDALGNTYTGAYEGVAGTDKPTLSGVAGYTLSNEAWNGATYTANITFPFPVSNAEITNPLMIGSHNSEAFLWRAEGTGITVLKDATADSDNYKWAIYPAFSEGNFTFTIKNLGTGKYINSTSAENSHAEGAVTLADEGTAFTVEANNKFKLATGKFLSVNSSKDDKVQIVGTWGEHGGVYNKFVAVAVEVASVTLDQTEATLTEAGATVTLVATVAPENATDKTVTWSTSDDKVATVVDGVVTAVANGKATITAKAGEKTATCEVTVAIPEVEYADETLINAFMTEVNAFSELSYDLDATWAALPAVLAELEAVTPLIEQLDAHNPVAKADVEAATATVAEAKAVAVYYNETYLPTAKAASALLATLEEGSEAHTALSAAIAACDLSAVTTVAELEAINTALAEAVEANTPEADPNDYTSRIKNAAVSEKAEWASEGFSWSAEKLYRGSAESFDFTQTIVLPAGQYKMTVKAAFRYASSNDKNPTEEEHEYNQIKAGAETHLAKVYAQTATYKYEGNVQNRWEGASDENFAPTYNVSTVNGKFVPNATEAVVAWFEKGKYVNELVFNVQEDGEVKIGIAKNAKAPNGDYTNIGAWTLTRLGDAEADPEVEEPTPDPEPEDPSDEVWAPSTVGNGKFYLYNVGAKGYLFPANNHAVHASVTKHGGILVELQGSDNVYTISTNETNAGKFMNDGGWMDGDAYGWTFELVSEGVYKLKSGENVLYWNGEGSTNTTTGADPGTDAAHWMLITEGARRAGLAEATEQNPVDATFFIKNPNISWGNGKYVGGHKDFDLSNSPSWKGTKLTDVWGPDANNEEANIAIEQYGKVFDNYQELKNIPNGLYHLTAKGFYRGNVVPYVYANDKKCELKVKGDIGGDNLWNAGAALRGDDYLLEGVDVLVTDGALRVGVKSDEQIEWCVFDDFRLSYYGEAEDPEAAALAQKKEAFLARAEKFRTFVDNNVDWSLMMINQTYLYPVSDEVLGDAASGVVGLVDKMDEVTDVAVLDHWMAEMDKAEAVLTEAAAAAAEFAKWQALIQHAAGFAATYDEATAEAAMMYMEFSVGYNCATVEAIETAAAEAATAYKNFVLGATPVKGEKFDLTFAIVNPNFEADVEGWTCKETKWNNGRGYNDVSGIAEIANWGASSWEASMSQTLNNLPNGKYIVKMSWMAANGIKMTIAANEGSVEVVGIGDQGGNIAKDGSVVEMGQGHRGWQYVEVEGVVVDGTLTISVNSAANAEHMWSNADAFELYYAGAAEVEPEYLTVVGAKVGDVAIVEGKATVESISTIDVIFDRPVALAENAGWATLADSYGPTNLVAEVLEAEEGSSEYVVRFTVSQEFNGEFTAAGEYELNIPEGFIVGAENVNCINAAIEAVITVEGGSVEPATPLAVVNVTVGEAVMSDLSAIVAAPETMIKVNFDGKFYFQGEPSIVDAEGEDASSSFDYMNGLDVDGSNSYIFMGKKEGTYTITLAKAQFNELEMMGWKAPAEDIVLKVTISVPDGIQNINADADAVIYDIHGRRVEKMTKGLYIVNGKKVLVK